MNVSVKMPENHDEVAEKLRKMYFGNEATQKDYRNAYIFQETIRAFKDEPSVLVEYLPLDDENIQRSYTLRVDIYNRLVTIAKTIDAPVASVYRAIVLYTYYQKLTEKGVVKETDSKSELKNLVGLLEKQIADCTETLNRIKEMM